jgi:hypothetical protein
MGLDTKTYWLTDRQSQCDFESDFDFDNEKVLRRQMEEKELNVRWSPAWELDVKQSPAIKNVNTIARSVAKE